MINTNSDEGSCHAVRGSLGKEVGATLRSLEECFSQPAWKQGPESLRTEELSSASNQNESVRPWGQLTAWAEALRLASVKAADKKTPLPAPWTQPASPWVAGPVRCPPKPPIRSVCCFKPPFVEIPRASQVALVVRNLPAHTVIRAE